MGVENARGRAVQYGIGQFAKQEGNMAAHQDVRVKNFVPGRQTIRLSGLRRGLMLGGSAIAFVFVAPQFAQAQTQIPASEEALAFDNDVSAQLETIAVGADKVAVIGAPLAAGGYSSRNITGHETLSGALFTAGAGARIIVGGSSGLTTDATTAPGAVGQDVISVAGKLAILDLGAGSAITGGAAFSGTGATEAVGGTAVAVGSGNSLTINGPASGSITELEGGTSAGKNEVGGHAINAGGAVELLGNVFLTGGAGGALVPAAALSGPGAAVNIGVAGSFTAAAGSSVSIEGGDATDFRAGILLNENATTKGSVSFVDGERSFKNTYNLSIGGELSVSGTSTLSGGFLVQLSNTQLADDTALVIGSPGSSIDLGEGVITKSNSLLSTLGGTADDLGDGSAVVLQGTITGGGIATSTAPTSLIDSANTSDTLQVILSNAHIALADPTATAATRHIVTLSVAASEADVVIHDSTVVLGDVGPDRRPGSDH